MAHPKQPTVNQDQIARFKAGDSQALNQLYMEAKPRLLAICRQFTKEESVAEDLLHDAFVVIITSLDKLKDSSKLDAWMTSIVHNVGYHYQQHLVKEQAAIRLLSQEPHETTEASQMPDYDQLQSLVAQLPEGYQQIFRLSVFEGLSHQEIGQLLGIAPHSSSSQLSHAKRMLRLLIRQSWVLILLLIAIPVGLWKLMKREEPVTLRQPTPEAHLSQRNRMPADSLLVAYEPAVRTQRPHSLLTTGKEPSSKTIVLTQPQDTTATASDMQTETAQTPPATQPADSIEQHPLPRPTDQLILAQTLKPRPSLWHISLSYNGQTGRRDDFIAATGVGTYSFGAGANTMIPVDATYHNWADYGWYLSNMAPIGLSQAETRSLLNIAVLNTAVNNGEMEARHEHQLPVSFQLMLSRQLNARLSLETGLSYTMLKSTTTTGSTQANIQEQQRLRYLGIPLRLGWQWYAKDRLSLYSAAGAMLELSIRSRLQTKHVINGSMTFSNETQPSVPVQWSASFGLGLQYDLTPHLGFFAEPSLQYFFDDGSDLKSYRTEHPLQITLPVGIRLHW